MMADDLVRYQWVKFKNGTDFPSADYEPGQWIIAEIDENQPNSDISLFGVEYTMPQSDVAEWGPEIAQPNKGHSA